MVAYGILNLHKPIGPTSRECVNRVARALGGVKVGHAGTLDPLARGVLVLLVGPAVRLMDEVHRYDKEYIATFRLGVSSPTGDLESECIRVACPYGLTSTDVRIAAEGFVGEIEQTPPAYSAIQISGKRAHELARQGKSPVIPSRRITIHAMEWLGMIVPEAPRLPERPALPEFTNLPEFSVRLVCSTGTYVRTLGNDIARRLGTECVMTELVRTRVGPFALEDAISLDAVESSPAAVRLEPAWRGVLQLPLWSVGEPVLRRLLDGQRLTHEELRPEVVHGEESRFRDPKDDSRAAILDGNHLLRAIVRWRPDGTWHCEKGIAHWDVVPFS